MNEPCKFTNANGYRCGSYAFNLYKEQIDQGDRCDHHYWREQAMKAVAHERDAIMKSIEELRPVEDNPLLQNKPAAFWIENFRQIVYARGEA
jgi:hypothetical protein